MGEYAKFNGQSIKIGTCESMYYLRADQARKVIPERGNVDPVRDAAEIRFRFPWPDEDGAQPGAFDEYDRAVAAPGVSVPHGVRHSAVQFTAPGYVVSLPCPESDGAPQGLSAGEIAGCRISRNGFAGAVLISQQKYFDGRMVLVCRCGGCGSAWRYETLADAQPVIDACEREAAAVGLDAVISRQSPSGAAWWTEIAARIRAGYLRTGPF